MTIQERIDEIEDWIAGGERQANPAPDKDGGCNEERTAVVVAGQVGSDRHVG